MYATLVRRAVCSTAHALGHQYNACSVGPVRSGTQYGLATRLALVGVACECLMARHIHFLGDRALEVTTGGSVVVSCDGY